MHSQLPAFPPGQQAGRGGKVPALSPIRNTSSRSTPALCHLRAGGTSAPVEAAVLPAGGGHGSFPLPKSPLRGRGTGGGEAGAQRGRAVLPQLQPQARAQPSPQPGPGESRPLPQLRMALVAAPVPRTSRGSRHPDGCRACVQITD